MPVTEVIPAAADVVVVGSGVAGMTAALAAAQRGAKAVVLERRRTIGGATAWSGGVLWVPGNHRMAAAGSPDDRSAAVRYVTRMVAGRSSTEMIETFVDSAPHVLRWLEESTGLHYDVWTVPDYRQELDGAASVGRSVEPRPFDASVLGEARHLVPRSPLMPAGLLLEELRPGRTAQPAELAAQRLAAGQVTLGQALVSGLLAACLRAGVDVVLEARATELSSNGGAVSGVSGVQGEDRTPFRIDTPAVVLASGGFESDPQLWSELLPTTRPLVIGPPGNVGDAVVMATELGAITTNMAHAWWHACVALSGDVHDGVQLHRFVGAERTRPHGILVNRHGQRFVNEAANYNDLGRVLAAADASGYGDRNFPFWLVIDSRHRQRYRIVTLEPGDPDPEWLERADTIAGLAAKIGVDPRALTATVERFNTLVESGHDDDFLRGDHAYDRFYGDPQAPHPTLGTIAEPPFYALRLHLGVLATKGGPRIDECGRVLTARGRVIPGLYAAGNAAGGPTGPAYFGGGTSIAVAAVFGYHAGSDAAEAHAGWVAGAEEAR